MTCKFIAISACLVAIGCAASSTTPDHSELIKRADWLTRDESHRQRLVLSGDPLVVGIGPAYPSGTRSAYRRPREPDSSDGATSIERLYFIEWLNIPKLQSWPTPPVTTRRELEFTPPRPLKELMESKPWLKRE